MGTDREESGKENNEHSYASQRCGVEEAHIENKSM